MTHTPTIPAVKVSTGTMAGDVFYGSFDTTVKNKRVSISVSNHIKDTTKEYEFRIAGKCGAGFINIHDRKGTPRNVISGYKKNTLVNIQMKNEFGHWMNVYTTKGKTWHSIDRGFLEVLTVGTMRECFPDMCDTELWNLVNTKTWADKAFVQN
jgi:hypothetical protein